MFSQKKLKISMALDALMPAGLVKLVHWGDVRGKVILTKKVIINIFLPFFYLHL